MKAAIYFGPGDIRCVEIDDVEISAPTDVKVKVQATSICGSDLHMYRGALDGIMAKGHSQTGHELIGEIVDVGSAITKFAVGDRVSMAYSCSCGECFMCGIGMTAHCETTNKAVYGFGEAFGNLNGTHAEYMVLPYAESHVVKVPALISDEAALTLSCNLPAAVVANELANIHPGETVAIIGCGPTGFMILDLVLKKGAARVVVFDKLKYRLELAERKGAVGVLVDDSLGPSKIVADMAGVRGFDKVIEVVGFSESLDLALSLVRPGGTVAALGVFCDSSFNLNTMDVFLRDITLHMHGFANVQPYLQTSLRLLEGHVIDPSEYFTHSFNLEQIDDAFRIFSKKSDNVLKVVIRP